MQAEELQNQKEELRLINEELEEQTRVLKESEAYFQLRHLNSKSFPKVKDSDLQTF